MLNRPNLTADVSVIIPALNEAAYLSRTLRQLSCLHPPVREVILVDGGSGDETVAIAQAAGIKVIYADFPRRSHQMNLGAQQATGQFLCFLHADTQVPDDLAAVIEKTLSNPAIACGGFISLMTGPLRTHWGVSLHNFLKTYYAPLLFRPHLFWRGCRLLFGDQVMFCPRSLFWRCGGFDAELPIMEEADLCVRLSQLGRICQVNRVVQSSNRRVAKWGPLKAHFIYLSIGCLWGLGVPAQRLKRFYEEVR
ncbi:TIGR04283 family arsenosugar biosynthesis glycosyltransferase [Sphaerothrix gracilis]|uniref:TIGR04283 family arsenosugar biosynthesis glycosyltransferase n=1 Tax=Sphaerothrix gracilis TaxID=3151835 RepID=UPI0031FBB805